MDTHQMGPASTLPPAQIVGKERLRAALDQFNNLDNVYSRGTFRLRKPIAISQLKANPTMTVPNDIAGTAALAICESLLLALNDHNVLPEMEIVGILTDAAAAHQHAPGGDNAALHTAVAALINGIVAGGNSVRRR